VVGTLRLIISGLARYSQGSWTQASHGFSIFEGPGYGERIIHRFHVEIAIDVQATYVVWTPAVSDFRLLVIVLLVHPYVIPVPRNDLGERPDFSSDAVLQVPEVLWFGLLPAPEKVRLYSAQHSEVAWVSRGHKGEARSSNRKW